MWEHVFGDIYKKKFIRNEMKTGIGNFVVLL